MGCCRSHCCCRKVANEVNHQSDLDAEISARSPHRCRCFRKFLAITCSQIGLLVLIVLYLIGGSYLFNYLEREEHQARLNHEIMEVKHTLEDLTDSVGRVKRSLQEETIPMAHQMGLQCVEFQIETLQKEIEGLKRIISHEHLKIREAEIRQLWQEVSGLRALRETKQLEQILDQTLNISLTSQIKTFEIILKPTRSLGEFAAVSSEKFNNLMRHIYEAVKAGWVLPPSPTNEDQPSMATTSVDEIGQIGPRTRQTSSTVPPLVLNSRLPRSDPWTLSGSFFYVITVITTIGYGEVVPVTKYGRLATIFYGLFGIPMMLLFLANLGSLMADIFRILYKRLCCCFIRDRKPSPLPLVPSTSNQKSPNLNNSNKISTTSQLPPIRSTPGRSAFGVRPGDEKSSALHELIKTTAPIPGMTTSLFVTLAGSNSIFTKALRARQESRNVRIPLWLILVIFSLYLIVGAIIFAYWEKWSFLDAMYFVFVTISTIGFGDMLPGLNDAHPIHRLYKFIACYVYVVLGLAMIAMCFDLMQSEMKRRSKKLARRVGLISSL